MIGSPPSPARIAGLGVWIVVSGLRPEEEALAAALGRFDPAARRRFPTAAG